MQNDVKPVPGPPTPSELPQQDMVVPAENALPRTEEENARMGGRISTVAFEADETRPQDMHGSVHYQETTADPGAKPAFWNYRELTRVKETIRG
jgi:hypothetical protein